MWKSRLSSDKRKHLRGLVRAAAYLSGLSLVLGAVQIHSARAEIRDRSLEMGRRMMALANATQKDVNRVSMNGQGMWIGSAIASDSVGTVLDRYESFCHNSSAQPVNSWRELASKAEASVDKSFLSTGTLRSGTDEEGSVVCFTKTESSKPSVSEALKTFGETGELGALGSMRYVYVKRSERGRTVVLTAWTDDKFNLVDFMPEEGKDAPGHDFAEIPRVPNAERVLSTRIEGTPYGLNVYRGKDAPTKVTDFYDQMLGKAGWRALDTELEKLPDADKVNPAYGRVYEKDGVVLTLASKIEQDATFTSLGLAGVSQGDPGPFGESVLRLRPGARPRPRH